MDEIFSTFINPATIFLCLAVYATTYFVRTIVEAVWKGAKQSIYWTEIWVPLGALVNGALLGLTSMFVWPEFLHESVVGRMMYGSICGLFSAFLYGRVRSWLAAKADGNDEGLPPVNGKG
jgi:hypothetical protein